MFKLFKSFSYAFKGIIVYGKTERNAKIHLIASAAAIALGIILQISSQKWLWLLLAITLVHVAEMINTAIERIVDLVSPEQKKEAGEIKDISAGFVLLTAIFSIVVGIYCFLI